MTTVEARHHDLLFLLGLAPLALGCSVGIPDDGSQFTSANPSMPPGDATGDSATEGETGSPGEDTTGAAEASASASVSVSVSASASDDGTTTTGESESVSLSVSASASASVGDEYGSSYYGATTFPPGGDPCEGYAYVIAGCYYGGDPAQAAMLAENCADGYEYYSNMYGPACGAAFEDTRACISQLSCVELMMYGMGACDAEAAAFGAACN